nr:phage tail tape measure protein [uncultured Holophaga sp.]
MTLQEIGISISAYDHTHGAISKVTSHFAKLKREIMDAWKAGDKLKSVIKGVGMLGDHAMIAGGAMAGALNFRSMAEDAVEAQHQLAELGNIANLSAGEIKETQSQLLDLSARTNQTQGALIESLQALMGRGMSKNDSMVVLEDIAKAATATGASVEDLSKTVFTAGSTMKMPLGETRQLLDSLAQAGKEGSFELKDMAKSIPELAAKAANLKIYGREGMVQLAAWGQIAKMGTDDPSVAANNLANFLDKITGKEAVKTFAKHGINLRAATEEARKSGDFIGTMLQIIQRDTKGDTFKLNELFGDVQVKNFLAPALQHIEEYRAIAAHSMGARGVVAQDYTRMMSTAGEKAKLLKIQLAQVFVPQAMPWIERAGKAMDLLARHPKILGAAVSAAMTLLAGGLALRVGSMALSAYAPIVTLGRGALDAGRFISYASKMSGSFGAGLASWARLQFPVLTSLATGMKTFGVAAWGTVKALVAQAAAWAMTPWGMITIGIVAVAAAGIWLWKNWDRVVGWFKSAWVWFQGIWSKVPGWAKWLFPMIQIPMLIIQNWSKIKTVFSTLWSFISGMAKQFWSAGANIAKAIWEGIKSAAMRPVEAVKAIVTKIRRFLPFSPAKEGPLQDIHRIRLVETIAESIKPTALLAKMGQVARVMVPTLSLAMPAPGRAASAPVVIHLSVNVQGTAQDGRRLAQELMPELTRQLEIYMDRKAMRSHG